MGVGGLGVETGARGASGGTVDLVLSGLAAFLCHGPRVVERSYCEAEFVSA